MTTYGSKPLTPIRSGAVDPSTKSLLFPGGSTFDEYAGDGLAPDLGAAATPPGVSDDTPNPDHDPATGTYRVYRARWHMIFIFCLLTFTNAFLWISFAPIAALAGRYYAVDVTYVNLLSVIFMLLYAPGSYLAMYLVTKYGLRTTILTGSALNAAGAWVRYASVFAVRDATLPAWAGYAVLLLGQSMPAIAQPLFTNVPAKLAADWFPNSERDVATVIGALFNPLGNAAGQVIPSVLVSCVVAAPLLSSALMAADGGGGGERGASASAHLVHHYENKAAFSSSSSPSSSSLGVLLGTTQNSTDTCPTAREVVGMDTLLLAQAILASVSALWAIGWFRSDPPTPPSKSAAMRIHTRRMLELSPSSMRLSATSTIHQHFRSLVSNGEFLKLLVGFGMGLAVFNAMLTVLGQIVLPLYGDTTADINQATNDAGMYGGVLIGAGLVGAGIIGPILDCTHMYRLALKAGFAVATSGLLFVLLQLVPDNQTAIAIGFGCMGFCMMPLLPTALEAAVECTFPVPEEMSATLLMLVGNVAGLGLTYFMQYLVSLRPKYDAAMGRMTPVSWCLLGAVGASAMIVFTFQGRYLRLEAEKKEEQQGLLLHDDLLERVGAGRRSAAASRA